jgi:hypothetical protein
MGEQQKEVSQEKVLGQIKNVGEKRCEELIHEEDSS